MSNMSYCRFHNTRLDMMDCLDVFQEQEPVVSDQECAAATKMFTDILEVMMDFGIIEEYSEVALNAYVDGMREE